VFEREITLFLGKLEVRIAHLGAGHTKGDTVVWLPSQKVLFSGDLVEYDAACYCGDAQLAQWPATLEALRALGAEKLVPGRGPALTTPEDVNKGLDYTKDFVITLLAQGRAAVAKQMDLKGAMALTREAMDPKFGSVFIYEHCLPFDVTRAYDEASGIEHPRIWTAERDKEMWKALQG
jgi:glyoxylase-like metal-dependent hydrolase (beta-lactamase superfamily II)